jgi:ribosomal protein S18 acetylase RimI-like enzyme
MDDLDRIEAFVRWEEGATSSRTKVWRFGTALFHDEFPDRWDSNFLRVERPVGDATAGDIAVEADRLYAGFRHREVVVEDDAVGERLAPGFAERGWEVDRLVYMARRRASNRVPDAGSVEEVSFGDLRPVIVQANLVAHGGMSEEAATMLADFRPVLIDRIGARFFAARVDGQIAAYCELYVHEDVAEINDVNTLEPFRGRGLARALVTRAADEGVAAGAELVFLIADEADWPKDLYVKLGFDRVGRFWQFTRPPEGETYR